MRDFAKVAPNIWRSEKFRSLGDNTDAKLALFYIYTSPHSNSCGCYDLPMGYGAADLHWTVERFRNAIDTLCDTVLIHFDFDNETVLIDNWTEFNAPSNAKAALGIFRQIKQCRSPRLALHCAEAFSAVLGDWDKPGDKAILVQIDTLCIGFRNRIDRPETETETETEMETRPDTETETREKQPRGPDGAAATPNGATPPAKGGRKIRGDNIREPDNPLLQTAAMKRAIGEG